MSEIEIWRNFYDENSEEVKNWDAAAEVIFSAWVDDELADKAEARCLRRAKNWQAKHPETCIQVDAREKNYMGETMISVTVRKHSADC